MDLFVSTRSKCASGDFQLGGVLSAQARGFDEAMHGVDVSGSIGSFVTLSIFQLSVTMRMDEPGLGNRAPQSFDAVSGA